LLLRGVIAQFHARNAENHADITAPLRFKEFSSLVNSRFDNGVIIFCERYVGAVRFEEVLVNMEAWAKSFQRRLGVERTPTWPTR